MPGRTEVAADLNRKYGLLEEQWIALQPGGRWTNKRWPVESYAAAARKLAEENPALRFSILGSREDALLGETIAKAVPGRCLDLTGALSLPQMVEWIRACRLMITNDTGPMHVAAALGIPVTGVFGPTEPARTGPYGQVEQAIRASLPCVPCMRDSCRHRPEMECLTSITPDRVVRSVMARL
jgi:lipopolysaccharide heptosyltransferase II